MADKSEEFRRALEEARAADRETCDAVMPLVYDELRRLAASYLKGERAEHTLQPTALVHEAYLKLAQLHSLTWRDRSHFVAMAARQMRRVLVEHARARGAGKRGGGAIRVVFDESIDEEIARDEEVVALDAALEALARTDERLARVVELRYFGGLTLDEAAAALGISTATVERDWATARAWLRREIKRGAS